MIPQIKIGGKIQIFLFLDPMMPSGGHFENSKALKNIIFRFLVPKLVEIMSSFIFLDQIVTKL